MCPATTKCSDCQPLPMEVLLFVQAIVSESVFILAKPLCERMTNGSDSNL